MFNSLLLCTHGTNGAILAESLVFSDLLRRNPEMRVTVLTIIDQDWQSMTGDDWLNSSKTHATFLDYVEEQMEKENKEDWQRLQKQHPAASEATFISRVGPIEETIALQAARGGHDLIVLGPQRKSKRLFNLDMEKGLRSRIDMLLLHGLLPCPLLIAPFSEPNAGA